MTIVRNARFQCVKAKNELAQKNETYAKFVAHNLVVLVAEMYATGIEAIRSVSLRTCTTA